MQTAATYLVVIEDSPESGVAMRFAVQRAAHVDAAVALVNVVAPTEFLHFGSLQSAMAAEARADAEKLLDRLATEAEALAQAYVQGKEPSIHAALPVGNGVNLPKPGEVRRLLWQQFGLGAKFICLKTEGRLAGLLEADGLTPTRVAQEIQETLIDFEVLKNFGNPKIPMPYSLSRQQISILVNPDEVASASQTSTTLADYVRTAFGVAQAVGAPIRFVDPTTELTPLDNPLVLVPAYTTATTAQIASWRKFVAKGGQMVLWPGTAHQQSTGPDRAQPMGYKLFPFVFSKIDEVYEPESTDSSSVLYVETITVGSSEILTIPTSHEDSTTVLARYQTPAFLGKPAVVSTHHGRGTVVYMGTTSPGGKLERKIVFDLLQKSGAKPFALPAGVYASWHHGLLVLINSTNKLYTPPPFVFASDRVIGIGGHIVPGAVGVYKLKN